MRPRLLELAERNENRDAFETEISRSAGLYPHDHIEKILSGRLRRAAEALLAFTRFHCKGTLIESSYYGIYFMRHQEIFAEMVTTKKDVLLLTLFDFETKVQSTYAISEALHDLNPIQQKMEEITVKSTTMPRCRRSGIRIPIPSDREVESTLGGRPFELSQV